MLKPKSLSEIKNNYLITISRGTGKTTLCLFHSLATAFSSIYNVSYEEAYSIIANAYYKNYCAESEVEEENE